MRGSALSAALLVGIAQAAPTKTTDENKRSPQFEWVGRPSTGITIPGQPIQPPRCDPRIQGICVTRPPKRDVEERDEEPVAAVPAKCDPRFLGICIPPRPGTKRDSPPEDSFHLPESDSKRKDLIRLLEGELLRLQNSPHKDKADLAAIDFIKAYLKKLAGIIYITAPDGTVTIFHPGKRSEEPVEKRQTIGIPAGPNAPKEVIKRLQGQLQALQRKKVKTQDDLAQISALKAALRHLAGIIEFTGPEGGISTFVPGKEKRQSDTEKAIKELQRQLVALQNKPVKDDGDDAMIAALQAMIKYTQGITQINAPPGVNTTLTIPGNP